MVQAVELTFDRPGDDRVRAEWHALQDARLPSLADHTAVSNRPHLTLDVRDLLDPAAEAALPGVVPLLPVRLRLGAVLLFRARRRWVVARHVVVDRALLDLHDAVASALGAGSSPLTARGSWIPHVTLARGVAEEQLPDVLGLLAQTTPYAVTALRLRRWDQDVGEAWEVPQPSTGRSL